MKKEIQISPSLEKLLNMLFLKLPTEVSAVLVGGAVRDALLGLTPKDLDVEFYNLQPEQLENALAELDVKFDLVGKSFGSYLITFEGESYDFTFTRKEIKNSVGYKGFEIIIDPTLSFKEAAERRDLTINAIMWDLKENQFIDPFNGIDDLENKILRPTSIKFKEDPLRVLRVMQFISRFEGFTCHEDLLDFSRDLLIEKQHLVKERVWVEWEKMLIKGKDLLASLKFIEDVKWIEKELFDLKDIEQDPIHHPEIFTGRHTNFVIQAAKDIAIREDLNHDETIQLILAAFGHDFGKAVSTFVNDEGKIVSPGHADTSIPLAKTFLAKIGCPEKHIDPILSLIENHMAHLVPIVTPRMVRRLNNKLVKSGTTVKQLCLLIEADMSGRPPLPKLMPQKAIDMLTIFEGLNIPADKPIAALVTGKDLIALGMKPGKEMGTLLDELYESQLDGKFETKEEGLAFFKACFSNFS